MTPDKRATLLTAFKWLTGLTAASLLLYGGYITQDVWLAAPADRSACGLV